MRESLVFNTNAWSRMESALFNYGSRPTSRGRTTSRFDSYLDTSQYNDTRDDIAPLRNRSSTPSAAVRRAMQVLDETKRQSFAVKNNRWSRPVDYEELFEDPIRLRRSPSPIKSRSNSPIRNFSSASWAPSRLAEIERENFQDALGDSEARREVLLKKLADAQKTMEIQNERLRDGEMDTGECRATIRLLKQVQHELETKLQLVQKEREALLCKSRRDAEEKEGLMRKFDDASREANRLKCQLDLLLADKKQHHVTLEHMHKSVKDFKDQIKSCSEALTTARLELESSRKQGEVAEQRIDLLEKEKRNTTAELEKNQDKQQSLINRNTELGGRLNRCQTDLRQVSEKLDKTNFELGHHREELAICRETIKKQNRDLVELQRSHVELQSDRERALRYSEELEKTLHSMKEINNDLKQVKVAHEDDITELHANLAKTRLDLAKITEENQTNRVELNQSRKTCKELSNELLQLRPEAEDLRKKVKEWEGTHNVDVQKLALLEAQKSQLTCEKEDATTHLSSVRGSYEELKKHHEREMRSLNKEVKDLRQEKERIGSQCRDAQAQYTRIREELESNNQHTKAQIDHWRQACSKLTSLVEEKEEDIRECLAQRREAEESATLAEAQNRTLDIQLREAHTSQEELTHLRMEQKRLTQECAENKQMIAVLEMQRDILAKSPSKSNSSDATQSKVEKLQAEVNFLQSKLKEAEADKDKHFLDGSNVADTSQDESGSAWKRLKGMNQILAEQVATLKQESETLRNLLDDESRIHGRASKEWKREKQQLDLRMASMADEIKALKSNQLRKVNESDSEVKRLKSELEWLKQDMDEKKQELVVARGELVVIENGKKRVEDRAAALEAQLEETNNLQLQTKFSSNENVLADSRIKNAKLDAAEAEIAVLRIQAQELEHTKTSQNTLIEALKLQLEKYSSTSTESEDSNGSRSSLKKEMKELKKYLEKLTADIGVKEKQLTDLKKKLLETQKLEQRARQERDELQGKAIIMESLNDSSQDLLKELKKVRQEKSSLEKQLNNFLTSKTCQTPPTSFSLVDDLDRELEKQYETVCERNKWLETRIASLLREIELLRDQNSLAHEQKVSAEREALRLREELKDLQMTSKGSRQQSEVENIHLQHRNAEKMQKIIDLERDLSEKKQLIGAMTKEMGNLHKKSEKGKISSFMKKLRKGSDPANRDPQSLLSSSFNGNSTPGSVFGSPMSSMDPGYSTMSSSFPKKKRANSLSPTPKLSSAEPRRRNRSLSKSPKSTNIPSEPLSPTLTYVSALETQIGTCTPSTGHRSRMQSPERVPGIKVTFEESSGHEDGATGDSPSSKHDTRSLSRDSSSSPKHESARGEEGSFFADDYITDETNSKPQEMQKFSHPPSPESFEPYPEELRGLPSPTSSPSLPSPSMSGLRSMPVYVMTASDESEALESESEEVKGLEDSPKHYPQPIRAVPLNMLSSAPSNGQSLSPPRPRSQPTLYASPMTSQTKKKNLSLV